MSMGFVRSVLALVFSDAGNLVIVHRGRSLSVQGELAFMCQNSAIFMRKSDVYNCIGSVH